MNKYGAVVQLVRMPACHAGGRGFEPLPRRQKPTSAKALVGFYFFTVHYSLFTFYLLVDFLEGNNEQLKDIVNITYQSKYTFGGAHEQI